jgi:PAS domain S-box-containing protein
VFPWSRDELVGSKINVLMGEPYRTYLDTGEARAIGTVRKVVGRRKYGQEFPCEPSVSVVRQDGAVRAAHSRRR